MKIAVTSVLATFTEATSDKNTITNALKLEEPTLNKYKVLFCSDLNNCLPEKNSQNLLSAPHVL